MAQCPATTSTMVLHERAQQERRKETNRYYRHLLQIIVFNFVYHTGYPQKVYSFIFKDDGILYRSEFSTES